MFTPPDALSVVLKLDLARALLEGYSTGLPVPDWINRIISKYYNGMTKPVPDNLDDKEHVSPHVVECDPKKHMEYVECKKEDGKVTWSCSFCHKGEINA